MTFGASGERRVRTASRIYSRPWAIARNEHAARLLSDAPKVLQRAIHFLNLRTQQVRKLHARRTVQLDTVNRLHRDLLRARPRPARLGGQQQRGSFRRHITPATQDAIPFQPIKRLLSVFREFQDTNHNREVRPASQLRFLLFRGHGRASRRFLQSSKIQITIERCEQLVYYDSYSLGSIKGLRHVLRVFQDPNPNREMRPASL